MSSTDMFTIIMLCVALLLSLLSTFSNPLIIIGRQISDALRVNVKPSINVFERDGDRLFVVEPEQIVLYNTAGVLYYYFEGGASKRLCPDKEQAIVRITNSDIGIINENGIYNITCTATNSVSMYNHFRNESSRWRIPAFNETHTIIDIINLLISGGYVKVK
ncbi:pif-4 [Matsumuraeses phaseoli granulovirus]|uniref:Pif-4 n=1 Tax=Matsumuraeses phaseoli granulovirus TaxID=2760664 RepID=A0AAE7SXQ9_9BBAC|nr:pif-4 [Matsumuraeses phaseoli granulovirus]QOD40043.1 pif-4 [Matsumuraeses phaseoli granulovirus]